MARIVVSTVGSWGDLFPLVPVVKGLRQSGYSVAVAANPAARNLIEAEDIEHLAVGRRIDVEQFRAVPRVMSSRMQGLESFVVFLRRFLLPNLEATVCDLVDVTAGADLVLAHPLQLGAGILAEHTGIRWATASISPELLPTRWERPQFARRQRARPQDGPSWLAALTWRAGGVLMDRLAGGEINRVRAIFGLPRVSDAFMRSTRSPGLSLLLCSRRYVRVQPDWDDSVRVTGFTYWDQSKALAADEHRWREVVDRLAHPRVVCVAGASGAIVADKFFELTAKAVRRAGGSPVILRGPAPAGIIEVSAGTASFDYVPLSELLPHVAAVIHHGGFGSTIAGLRAGVPAVVIPRAFDQFSHATRLEQLGVARRVSWRSASVSRISAALQEVMCSSVYAERAAAFARQLEDDEDGVDVSVRYIRDFLELERKF